MMNFPAIRVGGPVKPADRIANFDGRVGDTAPVGSTTVPASEVELPPTAPSRREAEIEKE